MTRIYLAVGHGLRSNGTFDPGASGGKWTEQSAGDIIVAEAARCLTALGADVRHEAFSNDPNYTGTIKAANAWPADIAVEVHHDWSGAPEGAFGHWYRADSEALADAIQEAVGDAGFTRRPSWHKKRSDLSFIKSTHMPSVLYECGRIGTGTLDTPEELKAMGRAIAQGIACHAGLKQPTPEDDMTPEQDAMLKEIRLSMTARSYDLPIMRAVVAGDETEVARLETIRDGDLVNQRRRLGMK